MTRPSPAGTAAEADHVGGPEGIAHSPHVHLDARLFPDQTLVGQVESRRITRPVGLLHELLAAWRIDLEHEIADLFPLSLLSPTALSSLLGEPLETANGVVPVK